MTTTTSDTNVRRKGSSGKLSGVLSAFKRVSFTRRASSDSIPKEQATQPPPPSTTTTNRLTRQRSASSVTPSLAPSSSRLSSDLTSFNRPPLIRLNSSSPLSELPKTWAEWTAAYRQGLIDFNDPPEPPSDLHSTDYRTPGGILNAPVPESELARQRAVDGVKLLHQKRTSTTVQDLEKTTSTTPDGDGMALNTEEKVNGDVTRAEENENFDPKSLPTYNILEELARKAQDRFDVETASVSLIDRDQQMFLAKRGFLPPGNVAIVERQETCCSHTILKACSTGEKDPFVVLDFQKDWRFKNNTFGDHSEGFYAAAPILLPSALGDGGGTQAGGVFCVLGKNPRAAFTPADRDDLERMADEASKEIQKWADRSRQEQKTILNKKRQSYKQELARSASQRHNLDTVDEIPTPPLTPDLSQLDLHEDDDPIPTGEDQPRRPSLADSATSEKSLALKTTSSTPAFPKRRGRPGVPAPPAAKLPTGLQSVIDLSTQLVAESIEMDFSYVMAMDLKAASEPYDPDQPSSKSPLKLISTHGLPMPAPQFNIDLHVETLTSTHNALLYVNHDYTGISGEFSTGLIVKVGVSEDGSTGYALGTFTEDSRRVLNSEDLLFLRSFARDIGRQMI